MSKRYFAIGLRGWIQVRVAAKPPIPTTTQATTMVKQAKVNFVEGRYGDDGRYIYGHNNVTFTPKELKMKVTIYKGGRTIRTIKSSRFASLLKVGVRENGMMELLPEQVALLKQSEEVKQ